MPELVFTRFVSSVKGRLVARWDAPGAHFGARVATFEERKNGAEPFTWDEECVVPLTAEFCARYDRELRNAVRNGDLLERNREEWEAWLKLEEQREAERVQALEAPSDAELEAAVSVEAPVEETAPPEAEAEPKRKKK